jgi:tripartite-type tricarboxylate transporter receptor subunit TctC
MLPDTPTFTEADVRDFEIDNFTGLVAPAGLPSAVAATRHAATVKALASPAVKERFGSLGIQPVGSTPEQFAQPIRDDLARWTRVIQTAGIRIQ